MSSNISCANILYCNFDTSPYFLIGTSSLAVAFLFPVHNSAICSGFMQPQVFFITNHLVLTHFLLNYIDLPSPKNRVSYHLYLGAIFYIGLYILFRVNLNYLSKENNWYCYNLVTF